MEKWYTINQAASIVGVDRRTIERRCQRGEYESKKESGRRLVLMDATGVPTGAHPPSRQEWALALEQELAQCRDQIGRDTDRIAQLVQENGLLAEDLRTERQRSERERERTDQLLMVAQQNVHQLQLQLEQYRQPKGLLIRLRDLLIGAPL